MDISLQGATSFSGTLDRSLSPTLLSNCCYTCLLAHLSIWSCAAGAANCSKGPLSWNPKSRKNVPLDRKPICPTARYTENKCPLLQRPIALIKPMTSKSHSSLLPTFAPVFIVLEVRGKKTPSSRLFKSWISLLIQSTALQFRHVEKSKVVKT